MDEQLLARLSSIENRLENIECSISTINYELGMVAGKVKENNMIATLVRYIVFPLILVVGGLVGVKLFIPT